ncbi:family 2 glycosyl transferase [Actibacterium sp. MT2.3-13A]|uniref:glycosyltransferase family 2 protein n=1 Tax=Actibacterium sp. MT2.3-13A TaxID=2828332 RepID=UPI001BA858EF|nr:family 2 glycosyl transferase [Actibacterium sp. MT2.3-13A]
MTGATPAFQGRLVVGIATMNRPGIVIDTVRALARQRCLPDLVILSATGPGDLDASRLADLPFACEVIIGEAGLTFQRNRMIERLRPEDIMLLLDDDFLLSPDYMGNLRRLFATHPDHVVLTGTVLADGIGGPGFDHAEGERQLRALGARPRPDRLTQVYNGYGCNMAFRAGPALEHGIRFDEALPLYSWLEDVDFSRRLAAFGRIARAGALTGVHLGTKTARSRGLTLGYSQIANPVYLMSKGTMQAHRALRMILRNLAANLLRSPRPEPWVDRRGRLRGNLLALADLLRGRLAPNRVLRLK